MANLPHSSIIAGLLLVTCVIPGTFASTTIECSPAVSACEKDAHCNAFGVFKNEFQLHGCASSDALVPNNDWTIYVPKYPNKSAWVSLNASVNVKESACLVHPASMDGSCNPTPPPTPPKPLPYEAIGSVDVGTGESSIFMFNGERYLLDNIFCGWIDHYGKWNTTFAGHSYARIRNFDTGELVANVSETIGTSFVSAFVDHQSSGDRLWLSALDQDRCHVQCGLGVLAISSTDLKRYNKSTVSAFTTKTCNTEVADVASSPPTLPPHRYVMILEPFYFMVNNNADGDLSQGWTLLNNSKKPQAPAGGPSIRHEGGYYYVITGGTIVYLCRSKDLGVTDDWNCTQMVRPTDHDGASGPGDGAIAPYAGFSKDAVRKDFPVMQKNLSGWDWNSNDADVCCTGGSSPSYLIWGASTQGRHPNLPPGSPSATNAIGMANMTLAELLVSFFN